MIRTLFIVAGGALVLCLACIGGAAALGGRDLAANDWTWIVTDEGHVRVMQLNRPQRRNAFDPLAVDE